MEKVRELLARVQQELRQSRQLRRLERTARAAMRWSKGLLRKELGQVGLWLKGFEVRGGRLADALQAIQVKIRIMQPDSHQIREQTVMQKS